MPGLQLFDHLLQFPLFQGMSRGDLDLIAGHTKFGFQKFPAGQKIVRSGDACKQFYFLLSGVLRVERHADGNAYMVTEFIGAPYQIQPEAIFGYDQRFTHTFTAHDECNFITIDKTEMMRLSQEFMVFRLNLLNIFATQTQKLAAWPWRRCPESLSERIVRFFIEHCIYPAGPKTFHILMKQLAAEVGNSRLDVSRALNEMQRKGWLQLHRGRIEIGQLEQLLMAR